MGAATTARAEFLKAAERSEVAISATLRTRWGAAAGDTEQSSLLVNQADATAEAARQLALMGPVLAVDSVDIEGVWFDLEGATVRVDYALPGGNAFGGAAAVDILVTDVVGIHLAEGYTTIKGLIAL